MHTASGVGVRHGPLCAATGCGPILGPGPEPIWAAAALPSAPATLPAVGGAHELRSLRSHVAIIMHGNAYASCMPAHSCGYRTAPTTTGRQPPGHTHRWHTGQPGRQCRCLRGLNSSFCLHFVDIRVSIQFACFSIQLTCFTFHYITPWGLLVQVVGVLFSLEPPDAHPAMCGGPNSKLKSAT